MWHSGASSSQESHSSAYHAKKTAQANYYSVQSNLSVGYGPRAGNRHGEAPPPSNLFRSSPDREGVLHEVSDQFEAPSQPRIPPRPRCQWASLRARGGPRRIPPEPIFDDEGPPTPKFPPPRLDLPFGENGKNGKGKDDANTPPPLKLAPPSSAHSATSMQGITKLPPSSGPSSGPVRSTAGAHLHARPINLLPPPPANIAVAQVSHVAVSLGVGDSQSLESYLPSSSGEAVVAGSSIESTEVNLQSVEEDTVYRCTGQCGTTWLRWEDVPHWSKSRRKKPWCHDCGDDKRGPWNEWGSAWDNPVEGE